MHYSTVFCLIFLYALIFGLPAAEYVLFGSARLLLGPLLCVDAPTKVLKYRSSESSSSVRHTVLKLAMVVNDETSSSGSAAPIVVRGSAPHGTFQIPNDGLRLDSSDSFLSRFKSAIRLRTYPTSLSVPAAKSNVDLDACVIASNSNNHSASRSSSRLTETKVSVTPPPSSSPNASVDQVPITPQSPTDCAPSTHISVSNADVASPSHSHASQCSHQPDSPGDQFASDHFSNHISAEQAADEVEDTLIQVNPDGESLLNSNRHSYPILRFCSATGLLDQPLLDKVVSCSIFYTFYFLF